MSLEPIEPDTALELSLADKDNELAEASLEAHEYRLGHFVRWYDQQNIENLNNLSGRQLQRYRVRRRDEGDLSPVSEKPRWTPFACSFAGSRPSTASNKTSARKFSRRTSRLSRTPRRDAG